MGGGRSIRKYINLHAFVPLVYKTAVISVFILIGWINGQNVYIIFGVFHIFF